MRRKILIWPAIIVGLSLLIGWQVFYNWLDCSERKYDTQMVFYWQTIEFGASWRAMLDDAPEQEGNAEYFEAEMRSHEEIRNGVALWSGPVCARPAKLALLDYMDAAIEVDHLLAQGADSQEVEAAINEADRLQTRFLEVNHDLHPGDSY